MKLLTAQQVAKLLGVNETTVRSNAAKDRLGFRAFRVGSLWRFPANEVYEYVYGQNWREIIGGQADEDTSNPEPCTE